MLRLEMVPLPLGGGTVGEGVLQAWKTVAERVLRSPYPFDQPQIVRGRLLPVVASYPGYVQISAARRCAQGAQISIRWINPSINV